ncbi:MAG: YCF48-related protein [Acidobacteriota bacterium]
MRAQRLLPVLLLLAAPLAAQLNRAAGEWRRLGPEGGFVNDLAVAPSNPRVVYASTQGSFYRSLDGGASWAYTSDEQSPYEPTVDAADPLLVYAQLSYALRSRNGGATWETLNVPGQSLRQLAAHPRTAKTVFATTTEGLFRSTDAGLHWKAVRGGLPAKLDAVRLVIDPVAPRRLYLTAAEPWRLFRSVDGGFSWQESENFPGGFLHAFTTHPRSPRTLYTGVDEAVFKSTDGGASWQATGAGLEGYVETLRIFPSRPNTVYAGTSNGLYRSLDGGATWSRSEGLPRDSFVAELAASGKTLVASAAPFDRRAGIYRSEDGGLTWAFSSRGLSALDVTAVDFGAPGTIWIMAGGFLFRSTDAGLTWNRVRTDRTTIFGPTTVAVDPADRSNVFVVHSDGAVWRSADAGRTWEATGHAGLQATELMIDPQTPSTLYATGIGGVAGAGSGIVKSIDGGATWTLLPAGPAAFYSDLDVAPSSPSTLYASAHLENFTPVFLRSTDGGATWTHLGFQGHGAVYASLAVDPLVATTVYTSDQGYIHRSTDGGATWSQISNPVDSNATYPLTISDSGRLYAAVWDIGVVAYEPGNPTGEILGKFFPWGFNVLAPDPNDPCRVYLGPQVRGLLVFTYTGTAECP